MQLRRVRNKILQQMYRPEAYRRKVIPPQIMETLDAIDQMIEQKITPLLSGLWRE